MLRCVPVNVAHPMASQSDSVVYLRPETKIEPLVCRWYAWPYLIAPAQHAMNVAFRHVPLLQSFAANPAVHLAATQDPGLFGGPFVALEAQDLEGAKALSGEMSRICERSLQFARDLKEFDRMLQDTARGSSLNPLYERLPASLRGLVELSYDTNHHPQIRLREELVYEEGLASMAQEISLTMTADRQRAFFMSTPRIPSPRDLSIRMPFSDPRFDRLAAMRTTGIRFEEMVELLDLSGPAVDTFRGMVTTTRPQRNRPHYAGEGVRIRYFGHACVLIQSARTSVLIDPLTAFEPGKDDRFTVADLPDLIDVVVLTHSHQDHCVPEVLMQLRHRVGRVVVPRNNGGGLTDPSMKLILKALGFKNITVTDPFDELSLADCRVVSLPFSGEHADLDICSKQAVFVEALGHGLMFLVDSDGADVALYEKAARKLDRRVELLFLGMECQGAPLSWLYGPLLTRPVSRKDDESRRLSGADCERAWAAVQTLRPSQAFVYAMGQEPWLRYLMGLEYQPDSVQLQESDRFLARCAQAGLLAERLHIRRELNL